MSLLIRRLFILTLALSLLPVLSACSQEKKVAQGAVATPSQPVVAPTQSAARALLSSVDSGDDIKRVDILSSNGKIKATVTVETVSTPKKLQTGLMFRKSLPKDSGMLFLMPERKTLSFWMKNTYVPLSIAYIDDGMRIVDIYKMRPLDEGRHYMSSSPCRYALEVNQGWFKANGIRRRDKIAFSR